MNTKEKTWEETRVNGLWDDSWSSIANDLENDPAAWLEQLRLRRLTGKPAELKIPSVGVASDCRQLGLALYLGLHVNSDSKRWPVWARNVVTNLRAMPGLPAHQLGCVITTNSQRWKYPAE